MAEKSVMYPKVTWNECMEFVKVVSSFNLKAVSYAEVGKKYGLKSPTAKSFTSKVSTCKQFGLITTAGGNTIQLTDTCKRLLFPTGEDMNPIIRACFGMAPLYSKLIAVYDGKAIPNKEILANILMNNYEIQKSVKDSAAQVFIESAEQLGLIKGGILCYSDVEIDNEQVKSESWAQNEIVSETTATVTNRSEVQKTFSANTISSESDYINQTIPFESGRIARFTIPVDATEDDLLLLHDMFMIILKRKFKFENI